jgi:hypothetical protein
MYCVFVWNSLFPESDTGCRSRVVDVIFYVLDRCITAGSSHFILTISPLGDPEIPQAACPVCCVIRRSTILLRVCSSLYLVITYRASYLFRRAHNQRQILRKCRVHWILYTK